MYQLLHSVALLSLSAIDIKSLHSPPPPSSWSGGKIMAIGTVLFSGSIYMLTLDVGPKKLLGEYVIIYDWRCVDDTIKIIT